LIFVGDCLIALVFIRGGMWFCSMKILFILVVLFSTNHVFSQSKSEAEVLNLSNKIFGWEVENNITSLGGLLSEKFKVVNSRGEIQTKEQYLTTQLVPQLLRHWQKMN